MDDDRLTKVAKAWASVVRYDSKFELVASIAAEQAAIFLAMFDAAHSCCKEAVEPPPKPIKDPAPKAASVEAKTDEKAPK